MKKNLFFLVLATITAPTLCSMEKESFKKTLTPQQEPRVIVMPLLALPAAAICLPKAPRFFYFRSKQKRVVPPTKEPRSILTPLLEKNNSKASSESK